jgi:antitoxin FitA
MTEIVLSNLEEPLAKELQRRAAAHRRTTAEEAKSILSEALSVTRQQGWPGIDAIHARLSGTRQDFSDSADLIREDRDR